ncbi:hypothetical protein BH10ACI3_BH10ACI3_19130 [soil metagenome]
MKTRYSVLVTIFTIILFSSTTFATYNQRQKITSTPRGVGAQFGNAVAVSGTTMVAGARFDGTTASQAGAAYVFVFDGANWVQQAVLLANDGAVADKFGYSVAISGNTIVVGAFNADAPLSNGGAAYVFVRNGTTWTQQQKLTASDGTADDQFGSSVGVAGDVAVVGANHADLPGNSEAGAVYAYLRTGTVWAQTQRLSPSLDVLLGDHFGDSIAMNGSRVVIGASGDDTPQTAAGAVYVFAAAGGGTFGFEQKLTIPDGTNGDSFGFSVGFDGTTIIGGATEDSTIVGQPAFGAAYVFTNNGSSWTQQQKLTASDGATVDRFGYSVAVSGDTVMVGAREDDTAAGPDTGSAYLYTQSGTVWTERQKLLPADTFNGDRFGVSAAFGPSGSLVIGAAEKALTSPNGQGAVFTFAPSLKTPFDYDGDFKSDVSVFRPTDGTWYINRSLGGVSITTFGVSTDKILPADYDGDGKTDIAVYRPSTGEWYILSSATSTFSATPFGTSTDLPAPGDFDGDGKADIAVYRPTGGNWFINRSTAGIFITQFGVSEDRPVPGDYDGDGSADIAVYRPSNGVWFEIRSQTSVSYAIQFGNSTDKIVPADYDGDGKMDVAIYRPSQGTWYIVNSSNGGYPVQVFGLSTDIPVPGDYDGDGRADVGIFRPSNGQWWLNRTTSGLTVTQFGANGDKPTESAFGN